MSINKNNVRHSKNFSVSNLNESSNNNNSNSKILDLHEKYHVPFGTNSTSQNSTPSNSMISNIKKALGSNSMMGIPHNQQKKMSINGKNSPKQLNHSGNEIRMQNQTMQYFSSSTTNANRISATGSKKMSRKESNGSMSEDGNSLNQVLSKQNLHSQTKIQQNDEEITQNEYNFVQNSNDNGQIQTQTLSSNSSNQISTKQPLLTNNQPPQFKLYSQMYEQMKQSKQAQTSNQRILQHEDQSNNKQFMNSTHNGAIGSNNSLSSSQFQIDAKQNNSNSGSYQSQDNQYQKIAQVNKKFQQQQQKYTSYSPESKKTSSQAIQFNYQNVMATNQKNIKEGQNLQVNGQPGLIQSNSRDGHYSSSENPSKAISVNSSLQLKNSNKNNTKNNYNDSQSSAHTPNHNIQQQQNQNMNFSQQIGMNQTNAQSSQPSPMKHVRQMSGSKGVTDLNQKGLQDFGQSKSTKHSTSNSKDHGSQLFSINGNPFYNTNQDPNSRISSQSSQKQLLQYNQQLPNQQIQQINERSILATSNSHSDLIALNQLGQIPPPSDDNNSQFSPLIKSIGSGKLSSANLKKDPNIKNQVQQQQQPQQQFYHPMHRQTYSLSNIKMNSQFQPQQPLNQSQLQQSSQQSQQFQQINQSSDYQNGNLQQYSKEPTRNGITQSMNQQMKRNQSNPKPTLNISVNNTTTAGSNTYYLTNGNNMNHTYSNLINLSTTNASHSRQANNTTTHLKQNFKNTTNMKSQEVSLENMKKIQIPSTGDHVKNYSSFMSGAQSRSPSKKESKINENDIKIANDLASKEEEDKKLRYKEKILRDIQIYWQKLSLPPNSTNNQINTEKKGDQTNNKNELQPKSIISSKQFSAYQNGLKQIQEYEPQLKDVIANIINFNNQYIAYVPNLLKENNQLLEINQLHIQEIAELKKKISNSDAAVVKLKKDLTKYEHQLANYTTSTSLNQEQLIVLSGEKSPIKIQQNQQLIAENQNLQLIIHQQSIEIEQYKEREIQIRDLLIEFNRKGLIQIDGNGDALIRSIHHNPESEDNQSANREEYKLCKKNLKELIKDQKGNNSINGNHLADDSRISDSQESSFGFIGKVILQEIETQQELENLTSESPTNNKSPKKVDENLKEKLKINMVQVQETQKLIQKQQAIQEQNEKDILIQQQLIKQQELAQQNNQFKQQKQSTGGKLKTQNIFIQNQQIQSPQQIQLQGQQQITFQQQLFQQQQLQLQQQQQQQQQLYQQQQHYQNIINQQPQTKTKLPSNQSQNSIPNSKKSEDIYIKDHSQLDHSDHKDQFSTQIQSIQQSQELQKLPQQQQQLTLSKQSSQTSQQQQQQQQNQSQQQQQQLQQQQQQLTPTGEGFISSGNGVLMPKPNMKKLQLSNLHNSVSPPKSTLLESGTMSVGGINKPKIGKIEIEDKSGLGFHDEFMSRLDEFSLSWRKAAERERKPHTQF